MLKDVSLVLQVCGDPLDRIMRPTYVFYIPQKKVETLHFFMFLMFFFVSLGSVLCCDNIVLMFRLCCSHKQMVRVRKKFMWYHVVLLTPSRYKHVVNVLILSKISDFVATNTTGIVLMSHQKWTILLPKLSWECPGILLDICRSLKLTKVETPSWTLLLQPSSQWLRLANPIMQPPSYPPPSVKLVVWPWYDLNTSVVCRDINSTFSSNIWAVFCYKPKYWTGENFDVLDERWLSHPLMTRHFAEKQKSFHCK